jgi:tRNA dimethylallyltransferase
VGKTGIAIQLAQHYRTEIISCDSRQFYRGMDIGTAKPTKEERELVKHHFIDMKEPDELFGAGDFADEAGRLIEELFKEQDILFLVGGSGLYIEALLNGMDPMEKIPEAVRKRLTEEYEKKGIEWLRAETQAADPEYFSRSDQNNPQRLMRALEVFRHSGKKLSSLQTGIRKARTFITVPLLIDTERSLLYSKIDSRVDDMISKGLVDEVRRLKMYKGMNALKTVGYREIFSHLEGEGTLEEAVSKIKQHTRNYAKRQLTWFRNRGDYTAFGPEDKEKIIAFLGLIMSHG